MASYDCLLVRPVEVTDAILTSSNVPEAVAATYAGGTTYAEGDQVGLAPVDGAAQLIYESLSAGNIGNPLPVPPATETAFWRYVASVYPVYSGAVTYALGDIVSSLGTGIHLIYESLTAGNAGNALTDVTKWAHVAAPRVSTGLDYNSTNRMRMFNESYGSQTECAEEIVIVLTPGTVVNTVALFNMSAYSVRVQQSVSGYDQTTILRANPASGWYDWYYGGNLHEEDEAVFVDIPPYPASTLTITISNPGGTAKCGVCVIGKKKLLGSTQWGMNKEVNDHSRVVDDGFGGVTLNKGKLVERLNLDVHLVSGSESEIVRTLKAHNSEPLAMIGSTQFGLSILYCYIFAWRVPCELTGGILPLELRGLT